MDQRIRFPLLRIADPLIGEQQYLGEARPVHQSPPAAERIHVCRRSVGRVTIPETTCKHIFRINTTHILAIDLGKFNGVLCWYQVSAKKTEFSTVSSSPDKMREAIERQPGVTVVIERMCYGIDYVQRTEAEYAEQERERVEKNLHRRAKELGYELTKVPRPPDTPMVEATPAN